MWKCWFLHKWCKWEDCFMSRYSKITGTVFTRELPGMTRECSRCGLTEDKVK